MKQGQITLIRHGKVFVPTRPFFDSEEFLSWIEKYNLSTVLPSSRPSEKVTRIFSDSKTIFASDLPRSIDSAKIAFNQLISINPIFKEADLVVPNLKIRLPLFLWLMLSRLTWAFGGKTTKETKNECLMRAEKAVTVLVEASKNGNVVLVGHGYFNSLIAKSLKQKGWQGPVVSGRKNWSFVSYRF